MNQTALHYEGIPASLEKSTQEFRSENVAAPSRRWASPIMETSPKHKSNNSSDNTLPNITRWCAAQLLPVTRALKSDKAMEICGLSFSVGVRLPFVASEERTDRPMRPHSSVPSEDHVTQVRPQSLWIDCQVQDVVFTCAFNLYKYYTIRR